MAKGRKTGGRTKGTPNKGGAELRALAQEYGQASIDKLAQLAGLKPDQPSKEPGTTQVAAIRELLDRGYGKAHQTIGGTEPDGSVSLIFRWADPPTPEPEQPVEPESGDGT